MDRRVAPFVAAAILGTLAQAFPWDQDLQVASFLVAVLVAVCAVLLLGALRGFPRPVNMTVGCLGLGAAMWPWGGPNPVPRAVIALAIIAICACLHYLPWARIPTWVRLLVPGGATVCVGFFTQANGSGPWLAFPLLLLVILWTALYHSTRDLVVITVVCLGVQLAANFGNRAWLIQTPTYGGLLLLVGASVHVLVRRSRRAAVSAAAVAEILRSLVEGRESGSIRQALCSTLTELLDAYSVCLFELEPEAGLLAPTAGTPRSPEIKVALDGEVFGEGDVSYGVPDPPAAILQAFRSAQPEFRPSLRALARTGGLGRREDQSRLGSVYCQPVVRDGQTVAVLSVTWRRVMPAVPPEQARLVAELADEVGLLLVQADLQGRVEALARTDSLTKVANRRHWESELAIAIVRAQRETAPMCVAVLDLDHFKAVNDDLGHQAGDRLLQEVASRWTSGLRQADVLGRYGGDEFCILLPNCEAEEALDVIDRLRFLSAEDGPFSAGVAQWNGEETDAQLLLRADGALYEAKREGGGNTRVAEDRTAASEAWVASLHATLAGAPVTIAFQPIKRLEDGAIVGWEALSRFRGVGHDVEPLFQAARRLGVSRDLDWLCRQAAIGQGSSLEEPLFINTSVWSLLDSRHPPEELTAIVSEAGLSPSRIVLELSERDRLSDTRVSAAVAAYRQQGFSFALDDLGAGHSTLEMLIRIEAVFYKIAASLLQADDERSQAAVGALTHFAQRTGGQVIAEGLQSPQQIERARALGIELGQGYLLGRPQPAPARPAERPVAGR